MNLPELRHSVYVQEALAACSSVITDQAVARFDIHAPAAYHRYVEGQIHDAIYTALFDEMFARQILSRSDWLKERERETA